MWIEHTAWEDSMLSAQGGVFKDMALDDLLWDPWAQAIIDQNNRDRQAYEARQAAQKGKTSKSIFQIVGWADTKNS